MPWELQPACIPQLMQTPLQIPTSLSAAPGHSHGIRIFHCVQRITAEDNCRITAEGQRSPKLDYGCLVPASLTVV